MQLAIFIGNLVFTVLFTVEIFLKLIAFRFIFFRNTFNTFDFIVIIISIFGFLFEYLGVNRLGILNGLLRTISIVRILRLIRTSKGLRIIFYTIISTLPALANIGGLLGIILFMFSILGI